MSAWEFTFSVLGLLAFAAICLALVELTWSSLRHLLRLSDQAKQKAWDEGWREGFRQGADVDAKTRRIGERAKRFGR